MTWQSQVVERRGVMAEGLRRMRDEGLINAAHYERGIDRLNAEYVVALARKLSATPDSAFAKAALEFANGKSTTHDFAEHVGTLMRASGARMYGCPFHSAEARPDGTVAITFKGKRDGIDWFGGMRITIAMLRHRKALGDPNFVVETTLNILDKHGLSAPVPIITHHPGDGAVVAD
jgi:hypothetical protein